MRRAQKLRRAGTVTVQVEVPAEVYDALLKQGPKALNRTDEALRRAAGLRKRSRENYRRIRGFELGMRLPRLRRI